MKKIIFCAGCFLLCCGFTTLFAQQGVVVTGGNGSSSSGTASFSVGQTDYITATNNDGTVSQGLQQPFEIFVIVGIEETNINLSASVYPNPSSTRFSLRIDGDKLEGYSYELYDESGKLIIRKTIVGNETNLDMTDLTSSKYFLKVHNNSKEIKTFKIIKLH